MRELFTGCSGRHLTLHTWDNIDEPVAVLQVVHGLHDNMAYYNHLAEAMKARNVIVVGLDCPLCGDSCDNECIDKDYFGGIVKDNVSLIDESKKKYALPIFLVGLGSGSLIVERCIQIASEHIDGAILVGATFGTRSNVKSMAALLKIANKFDAMNFNNYFLKRFNKRFKKEKSSYAWLSNDKEYIESIAAEKQNLTPRPIEYYISMYRVMEKCMDDNHISTIRKSLPLLILSGEQDAMGGFGKKVLKLYDSYVNAAMTNVKMRLFQGSRHALLHSSSKKEAMRNIGDFIEENHPDNNKK